jgi:hypothetical protein
MILDMRKEIYMAKDRRRILELALESLENKKRQLDEEIAQISRELRGGAGKQAYAAVKKPAAASAKKRFHFSKEERQRRSARMKAYWANRSNNKSRAK